MQIHSQVAILQTKPCLSPGNRPGISVPQDDLQISVLLIGIILVSSCFVIQITRASPAELRKEDEACRQCFFFIFFAFSAMRVCIIILLPLDSLRALE